jgi:hypothetical protein
MCSVSIVGAQASKGSSGQSAMVRAAPVVITALS